MTPIRTLSHDASYCMKSCARRPRLCRFQRRPARLRLGRQLHHPRLRHLSELRPEIQDGARAGLREQNLPTRSGIRFNQCGHHPNRTNHAHESGDRPGRHGTDRHHYHDDQERVGCEPTQRNPRRRSESHDRTGLARFAHWRYPDEAKSPATRSVAVSMPLRLARAVGFNTPGVRTLPLVMTPTPPLPTGPDAPLEPIEPSPPESSDPAFRLQPNVLAPPVVTTSQPPPPGTASSGDSAEDHHDRRLHPRTRPVDGDRLSDCNRQTRRADRVGDGKALVRAV